MLKRLLAAVALLAGASFPVQSEEPNLVEFKVMTLDTAMALAQAALADCRKRSFQVAVAVVDRSGNLQVALRDRFAGAHTPETARRKAWTAVSFRADTLGLAEVTQPGTPQSGVRSIPGVLMLGGGVPVMAAGAIVGGVGVSGAPGGDMDDACARAGIEVIADRLNF